jgi:D-alanyl-D-alanine carboxypeptidase
MDIGVKPAVAALSAIGEPTSSRRPAPRPDVIGQSLSRMLLGAPPAALGQTRPSAPLVPPVGIGEGNEPIDLMTSGSIKGHQVAEAAIKGDSRVVTSPSAPAGSWVVQIGAAPTQDGASRLLATATGRIDALNDLRPYVERFDKNGQTFFRARFIGFGDEDAAAGMCKQLKKAKMSCLAMQS